MHKIMSSLSLVSDNCNGPLRVLAYNDAQQYGRVPFALSAPTLLYFPEGFLTYSYRAFPVVMWGKKHLFFLSLTSRNASIKGKHATLHHLKSKQNHARKSSL